MGSLREITDEEACLRLVLKFEPKPCGEHSEDCKCCIRCRWILECYQAWCKGYLKTCRNKYVLKASIPSWCPPVARRVSELLGFKKKRWVLPSKPPASDQIEKWDDEK